MEKIKRYILKREDFIQFEFDSISEIAKFLGCSRQNINQKIKKNKYNFKMNEIEYQIIDRLLYEHYERLTIN